MSTSALERRRVARAFGAVLRTERTRRGLSQGALCEGAALDRTYPSLLERGLRTPTLTVLLDIARALDLEPSQLITAIVERLHSDEP